MSEPQTIAYVGNFGPRHSTENHVKLSLEALGHRVVPVQEDALHAGTAGRGDIGWPELAGAIQDEGADLLLWTRTWQHVRPEEQDTALEAVRAAGIPSASYHLDLYLGLDREEQIGREAFWRTDVVCTADGALADDEWWSRFGVRHRWVRPGVLAAECVPGTPQPQWAADGAFVGSCVRYHEEWPYRRQLVQWLQRTYGSRQAKLWPQRGRPAVRNEELDLYASTKVVVGDSLCIGFDRPRYWSDRVYETIGRGGFLVMPHIEGLSDEFTDGEHLRYYTFGDFGELRALIDYYVDPAHDDERRAIAAAGQAHVRENCTYTHRVAELLAHVDAVRPHIAERPPRPPRITTRRLPTGQAMQLRDGTTDEVTVREVWDQGEYHGAETFLRGGGVALDVGANIGAWSLWALHMGARLVHAYEPEPGNLAQLRHHVAGKPVTVHGSAVGPEDGELWLAPGPGGIHGGGTHVGTPAEVYTGDGEATDNCVQVPVVAINDVLAKALADAGGELAVWKMDVEGAEYGIIDAVDPELLRGVRCIVMEFHGPGMPHLPHLQGAAQVGPMLAKLAEFGRLDTLGRPSMGGTLTWKRY
jgi:FkbM family methyltransferase